MWFDFLNSNGWHNLFMMNQHLFTWSGYIRILVQESWGPKHPLREPLFGFKIGPNM